MPKSSRSSETPSVRSSASTSAAREAFSISIDSVSSNRSVRGVETLQQLRDLGVQLALDDFGTGYSSLSYLRNLPLDSLKIAREFVEGLAFSEHDAAFVRLIVGLAKTVGLKVVAEGIETRAQLDMLREMGCDLGQGYYFSKPMDVDADWHGTPAAAALA